MPWRSTLGPGHLCIPQWDRSPESGYPRFRAALGYGVVRAEAFPPLGLGGMVRGLQESQQLLEQTPLCVAGGATCALVFLRVVSRLPTALIVVPAVLQSSKGTPPSTQDARTAKPTVWFKQLTPQVESPPICGLVAKSYPTLVTPRTVAYLSIGFSRQEYRSGLPFPSPGDLPDPEVEPRSPALQVDSLPSEPPGEPCKLPFPPHFLPGKQAPT